MRKFFQKLGHSFKKRALPVQQFSLRDITMAFNSFLGRPTTFDGIKIPLHKIPKASVIQLKNGSYEDVERDLINKYIPRGAYVIELGASIGVISCHILKRFPVRLISFEALPAWVEVTRETVNLNFINAPFEVVPKALGKSGQESATFFSSQSDNLGGRILPSSTADTITVPTLSLTDLNRVYEVPNTAWLVMDIEGMEWDIARHQVDALRNYEGVIVECHLTDDGDAKITPAEIVTEITAAGFKLIEKADHDTHIVAAFKRSIA